MWLITINLKTRILADTLSYVKFSLFLFIQGMQKERERFVINSWAISWSNKRILLIKDLSCIATCKWQDSWMLKSSLAPSLMVCEGGIPFKQRKIQTSDLPIPIRRYSILGRFCIQYWYSVKKNYISVKNRSSINKRSSRRIIVIIFFKKINYFSESNKGLWMLECNRKDLTQ